MPRREVLDPAGKTIAEALARLGFEDVSAVRAGKRLEVVVRAADEAAARTALEEMCDRLLANPVVEDWSIDSLEAEEVEAPS
ncbi:MAG: phosphoribosylformylglycinamidine synthase subunit PurS [Acidobacteriota bacterium]